MVLPDESIQTLALWSVHTYLYDYGHVTPYISINSATMREGKTRVMETASLVVRNPQMAANISTAALYRLVDAEQPSLMIDEFDQSGRVTEDFRRILNSGSASNGYVIRSVKGTPRSSARIARRCLRGSAKCRTRSAIVQSRCRDRSVALS